MSETCCRIERLSNGYEVEVRDPDIVKANAKPSKGSMSYQDPMRSYAFKTVEEVLAFLEKNLDKALPDDEFESAFDAAAGEEEDD